MQRFFIDSKGITTDLITILDTAQVHHIKDVLRFKEKDSISVFDEKSNQYIAQIIEISAQKVTLKIKEKVPVILKNLHITIACAIPKKSKFDDIVDKLTQLGVERIIPLRTERVIVKLGGDKEATRLTRWRKIALSASQQSQQSSLSIVDSVKEIEEVLADCKDFDLKLIPTLSGERKGIKDVIDKFIPAKRGNILVFIGPEGDFTDREVGHAIKSGCIPVTLGNAVLRVETAAISVASFLKLYADS